MVMPFEWDVRVSSKDHTVTAPTSKTGLATERLHHTTGHYSFANCGLSLSARSYRRIQTTFGGNRAHSCLRPRARGSKAG